MYFVAEINDEVKCRLMCDKHFGGKLVNFKEIPYSKFFGFFVEHIHETRRDINNNFDRDERTMIEMLKEYPVEFSFILKDNKAYNQGISADVSDFQVLKGGGYGSNPSNLNRLFNKQIILIFKFINEPPFMETFKKVWETRPIFLQGTMNTKKSCAESLQDISVDFDTTKVYYTYDEFTKSPNDVLNPNKMLFMFNTKKPKKSVYVENLNKVDFVSAWEFSDILEEINFINTNSILGD